jgi:hypothetical protein
MTTPNRNCLLFLAAVLCASAVAAQKTPATDPTQQEKKDLAEGWKPSPPDVPALEYGAALEAQASAALRQWVRKYSRTKMGKATIDLAAVHAAVDAQYPRASAPARDAVVYLLLYTAYKRRSTSLAETERILGLPSSNPFAGSYTSLAPPSAPAGRAVEFNGTSYISPDMARGRELGMYGEHSTTRVFAEGANMRAVGAHVPRLRARVETSQRMLSEAYKQSGATPPNVLRKIR